MSYKSSLNSKTRSHGLYILGTAKSPASSQYVLVSSLYWKIVKGPRFKVSFNCAPLAADLFLFCYERDFMNNLSSDNQADVIKVFNLTSRYLEDLLNIANPYFEGMVNQIYPP